MREKQCLGDSLNRSSSLNQGKGDTELEKRGKGTFQEAYLRPISRISGKF